MAKGLDQISNPVALMVDDGDMWLQENKLSPPGPVRVDFASPAMLHRRRGGHNELLGKAVGIRRGRLPCVIDATAGLGRDAYVLADLGCSVTMLERSDVLALLLEEALKLALISQFDEVRRAAARLSIQRCDSTTFQADSDQIIYLDPMFEDRKGSAAAKKDLSVLQALHGAGAGHEELVAWAFSQPVARIVVKRPLKADLITKGPPSHVLRGKSIRFDVYSR
jgi:16S rRNA (guanine1516-N2)-methyltransferase